MEKKLHRKMVRLVKEGEMHQKVVLLLAVAALIVVGSVAGVLSTGPTQAETEGAGIAPSIINYQGVLLDLATGDPVSDGAYDFVFSIYDTDIDDTPLWTETQTEVMVKDGLFNVMLGSVEPLSVSLFDGSPRYLGITVGEDDEMTPRQLLASVPYALQADTLDGLDSSDLEDLYVNESGDIIEGSTDYHLLTVENTGNGDGILGHAYSSSGVGTEGEALGEFGVGVYGSSLGSSGIGVRGYAKDSGDVENYGGLFEADGEQGYGVRGIASNSGDVQNFGGYFVANGERGIGVHVIATGPNSYAGYFVGDVHVDGEIVNPAIPIAYGHVRSDATIASGTSNIGVNWNSSSNWYEITIADEYYNSTDYVTVVTTVGTHDGKIRVSSTGDLNGKLLVFFQTLDGVAIGSSFNFVTYKP